jgi:hypothetical protein
MGSRSAVMDLSDSYIGPTGVRWLFKLIESDLLGILWGKAGQWSSCGSGDWERSGLSADFPRPAFSKMA